MTRTGWYSRGGGGGASAPPFSPVVDGDGTYNINYTLEAYKEVPASSYNFKDGNIFIPLGVQFPPVSTIPYSDINTGELVELTVTYQSPGYVTEGINAESGEVIRTVRIKQSEPIQTSESAGARVRFEDVYPIPSEISSKAWSWSGSDGSYCLPETDMPVIHPPKAGGGLYRHPRRWVGSGGGIAGPGHITGTSEIIGGSTARSNFCATHTMHSSKYFTSVLEFPETGTTGINIVTQGGNGSYITTSATGLLLEIHLATQRNVCMVNPVPYKKTGPWGRFWKIDFRSGTVTITDWVIF